MLVNATQHSALVPYQWLLDATALLARISNTTPSHAKVTQAACLPDFTFTNFNPVRLSSDMFVGTSIYDNQAGSRHE